MDQNQEEENTELPIDYYDELRRSNVAFTTQLGSSVVLVNETLRLCKLTSLLPTTVRQAGAHPEVVAERVFYELSAWIAMNHFNQRNATIVPLLKDLEECNMYLTMEFRDTQFSPIDAAKQYLEDTLIPKHSLATPLPFGLIGASRSAVSVSVATLAGVDGIPLVSAESTSSQLDRESSYPFFARTIPTNSGEAMALLLYLESIGVEHLGVMYVRDSYGTDYFAGFLAAAASLHHSIHVHGAPYEDGNTDSIDSAVARLKASHVRYFAGIFGSENHKIVLERIHNQGLIGNSEFAWFFGDGLSSLSQPGYELDPNTEAHLASAIHGSGVVLLDLSMNEQLETSVLEMYESEEMMKHFVSMHAEDKLFESLNLSTVPFSSSAYNGLVYDAVMTLAIAACQTNNSFFSGAELYNHVRLTEFEGASGFVSFDPESGTRRVETTNFQILNVLANPIRDGVLTFSARRSVSIATTNNRTEIRDFSHVYWNNSTTPPMPLPEVQDEDLNYIGRAEKIVGLTMAGIVIVMSTAWMVWTIRNRKRPVIRASQPAFLGMLCVGTLIMASALVFASLEEPVSDQVLDIACMAVPWLFSIGFVTAFSALFTKTWRINKLFHMSQEYRRVEIRAKHVLPPFLILMAINIAILTAWTIVSPLEWTRIELSTKDEFGRSTSSYGTCYSYDDTTTYLFLPLLLLVNFCPLAFATYQAYQSRLLPPSNFNESHYIGISLAMMTESFLIALPVFFAVHDNPSVFFFVKCLLVFIVCLAILLPIFVPKYLKRNERPQGVSRRRRLRTSAISRSNQYDGSAAFSQRHCRLNQSRVTEARVSSHMR